MSDEKNALKFLTILIPTRNRVDFIIRLFEYYELINFSGIIYIGDSSEASNHYRIQHEIKKIKNYRVVLHHYPNKSIREVMELMSEKITTPYAMFSGDDDFVISSGAVKAINFLQKNDDYIAAHGAGFIFNVLNNGPYGRATLISRYPQPGLEESCPVARVDALFHDYWVPLFSIFRAKNFLSIWKGVSKINDITLGSELIPSARASILGKNKLINAVSLLRQAHDNHHHLPNLSDLTEQKGEGYLAGVFTDSCKNYMTELGVPITISSQCLLGAFKSYMFNSNTNKLLKNYNFYSNYVRGIKFVDYMRVFRKKLRIFLLNKYLILKYPEIKITFKFIRNNRVYI